MHPSRFAVIDTRVTDPPLPLPGGTHTQFPESGLEILLAHPDPPAGLYFHFIRVVEHERDLGFLSGGSSWHSNVSAAPGCLLPARGGFFESLSAYPQFGLTSARLMDVELDLLAVGHQVDL